MRLVINWLTDKDIFDTTGLPVQVRDAALKIQDEMPKSDVNKEYYTQNMEREVSVNHMCHDFRSLFTV